MSAVSTRPVSTIQSLFFEKYIGPEKPFRLGTETVLIDHPLSADEAPAGCGVWVDIVHGDGHHEQVAWTSLTPMFDLRAKPVSAASSSAA